VKATTGGLCWLIAGWTPDSIEKLITKGHLRLGEHFHQPLGKDGPRLFDVAKVEAWIAGEEQKAIEIIPGDPVDHPTPTNTRRPPHAEHAEEEAQEAPEGPEAAAERWLRTRRP